MALFPDLSSLSVWPDALDPLICFGFLLFVSVVLADLFDRLRLPRISAYVVTGILLGLVRNEPSFALLIPTARSVFELAFALIMFELGQRIDLSWLGRNPWLLVTSVAESLLAFVAIISLMLLMQFPPVLAAMIAAITISTGPAVILGVARDKGARGQMTDRLYLLSALSTCYSFLVLSLVYAWQHGEADAPLTTTLLHPLYLLCGSVVLGALAAGAVLGVLGRIRPGRFNQTLAAVGLIIMAVALARSFGLSVVVSLLSAGVLSRSLDRRRLLQPMDFGLLNRIALIIVFVATGTLVDFSQITSVLLPAIGLLAARALAKTLGIFMFSRASALPLRKASLLSIGLLPMSGAALLWVDRTAAIWPELGSKLATIIFTALLITELFAPPALQYALRRANETGDNT